jgi:hypothetical protein
LANVADHVADEFARLGGGGFAFARVTPRTLDGGFLGHGISFRWGWIGSELRRNIER